MAYEFDPALGPVQTIEQAVGQWNSQQQNGLRRYPLCYGAIQAGMQQGDPEATAHYNANCVATTLASKQTMQNEIHWQMNSQYLQVQSQQIISEISILDLKGRTVLSLPVNAKSAQINTRSWPNGILFLQVLSGGRRVSHVLNHGLGD